MNAPLWMLAAVPDVLLWLKNAIQKLDPDNRLDDMPPEILRFHGITPEDLDTMKEEEAFNADGRFRPRFYSNLIKTYLVETGRPLEVSVSRNTVNDIYAGSDLFNRLGVEDNYTLIAKMTTLYYQRLRIKYSFRFPDEKALISAAGILDAQIYINKTKEITPEQVKGLASTASVAASPLLEFIIMLETLMLTIDTPQYSSNQVEKAIRENAQRIQQMVEETMHSGETTPMVVRAVDDFMNKRKNRKVWMLLGISNK